MEKIPCVGWNGVSVFEILILLLRWVQQPHPSLSPRMFSFGNVLCESAPSDPKRRDCLTRPARSVYSHVRNTGYRFALGALRHWYLVFASHRPPLIFPSWLEHQVERFAVAGERISIAFNVSN